MIREVMKICGLDCDETCDALCEVAGLGVDIYVPASRLEEAQSLLTAPSGSEE